MPCIPFRGGYVCTTRPKRARCADCGQREHTRLCDGHAPHRRSRTCDRKLCDQCTRRVGDRDYCAQHPATSPAAQHPQLDLFGLEGEPHDLLSEDRAL